MTASQTIISIDFWNTLVKGTTNGLKRHQIRLGAIHELGRRHGRDLDEGTVIEAFTGVSDVFDRIWLGEQRTLTAPELIELLVKNLQITPDVRELKELEEIFDRSLLESPPDLADGVTEAVRRLARTYPLAIISDTMYTPGRTLRKYMDEAGLLGYFSTLVFSDEAGYSKPDIRAFRTVLDSVGAVPEMSAHVGDMEKTDITGARNAGMRAILYTGVSNSSAGSHLADAMFDNWHDITDYLLGN